MTDPDDIAAAILGHLRAAMEEIEGLAEELDVASLAEASEAGSVGGIVKEKSLQAAE